NLLLTHTMDDGPAPATFISIDVNYPADNPASASATDWPYRFQLTNNNAASQPYFDNPIFIPPLTSADYEPIYGLGVEPWQRYSKFESIAFPLVENDFTWDTGINEYELEGNYDPTNPTTPDPEGSYVLFTSESNEFTINPTNVGTDPTNDYLLARAAAVPG